MRYHGVSRGVMSYNGHPGGAGWSGRRRLARKRRARARGSGLVAGGWADLAPSRNPARGPRSGRGRRRSALAGAWWAAAAWSHRSLWRGTRLAASGSAEAAGTPGMRRKGGVHGAARRAAWCTVHCTMRCDAVRCDATRRNAVRCTPGSARPGAALRTLRRGPRRAAPARRPSRCAARPCAPAP